MENNIEEILAQLKGAKIAEFSFSPNEVCFHIEGAQNYKISSNHIGEIIIEPRTFDCPGMSMHTQILWLIDECFPFLGKEIEDAKIVEGQIIALQFANGAMGFKIEKVQILSAAESI